MAIETPVAQPPQTTYDEWRTRRWSRTGRTLALLWLVALIVIVLAGERRSDLGALHGGLAEGSVSEVRITGLSEGGVQNGFATVRLGWDSGFLHRYTEIIVASSGRMAERASNSQGLPVVVGDPVATLENIQPGVAIAREDYRSGSYWEPGGWTLRGWPGVLVGLTFLATLFLLLGGPQPWRATRWAWFWIVLASPLFGALAYALLGGPVAAIPPKERERRLSGGWAFLIGLFLLGGFGASGDV
jgi:hypothetical protein